MPIIQAVFQLNTDDGLNLIYHLFGWSNTKSLRNVTIFIILVDRMITLSYFTRFSRAILLNETVFNSDELILQGLKATAS